MMAAPALAAALVDINTADLTTLETLSGIGPSKGQAIIDYRTQNGLFGSIEDIQKVSGIGPSTYASIKNFITVDESSQSQTTQASTSDATTTQTQSADTQAQTQAQSAPVDSYVPPPLPQIFADAGGDETIIVGADVAFSGRAYDRAQATLDAARFIWNFGDGTTAEGPAVMHHFTYPGRYAVVLSVADNLTGIEDQITVTAEPAKLAFALLPSGGVSIEDLANHDLDLSGWRVVQGGSAFVLPDHSKILSGATMQIDKSALGFWSNSTAELDYPNGTKVLAVGATTPDAGSTPSQIIATNTVEPEQKCAAGHAASCQGDGKGTFAPAAAKTAPALTAASATSSTTTIKAADLAAAAGESQSAPTWLFVAGAVLLAAAGAGAVWYGRYFKPVDTETPSLAEQFDIE